MDAKSVYIALSDMLYFSPYITLIEIYIYFLQIFIYFLIMPGVCNRV